MDETKATLDALKKDPKAAKLLSDPAGLKALLTAPETQQLMALLNQNAGGGLKAAAQAAAGGKPEALMGLLSQVTQSKEGAAAMENLQKKTGQA